MHTDGGRQLGGKAPGRPACQMPGEASLLTRLHKKETHLVGGGRGGASNLGGR